MIIFTLYIFYFLFLSHDNLIVWSKPFMGLNLAPNPISRGPHLNQRYWTYQTDCLNFIYLFKILRALDRLMERPTTVYRCTRLSRENQRRKAREREGKWLVALRDGDIFELWPVRFSVAFSASTSCTRSR